MTVHRANLGRLKKRSREYIRKTYQNKKQLLQQTQHKTDYIHIEESQPVGPPSTNDVIYQTYLNQLHTNSCSLVVRQDKLKPIKEDPIIKINPSKEIVRLIKTELWQLYNGWNEQLFFSLIRP